MKYLQSFLLLLVCLIPSVLSAGTANMEYFTSSAGAFRTTLNFLIPVLIALALAVFIWGLVVYITHSGDEPAKQEGKNKMIWGVLALFVIVSIWGIVALLQEITGTEVGTGSSPVLPTGGLSI